MVLKIKSSQVAGERDSCFCGKPAAYNVQLTNSKDHCPVCLSCLEDRLNKTGQSFMVSDDYMLQSFKDANTLFIVRKIHGSFISHSVAMTIDNKPMNIIGNIKGEQLARKALRALETRGIDWKGVGEDKKDHAQWKDAKDCQYKIRLDLGII